MKRITKLRLCHSCDENNEKKKNEITDNYNKRDIVKTKPNSIVVCAWT